MNWLIEAARRPYKLGERPGEICNRHGCKGHLTGHYTMYGRCSCSPCGDPCLYCLSFKSCCPTCGWQE